MYNELGESEREFLFWSIAIAVFIKDLSEDEEAWGVNQRNESKKVTWEQAIRQKVIKRGNLTDIIK